MPPPLLSICIPIYNGIESLGLIFSNIEKLTNNTEIEFVLSDDFSSDGTIEYLKNVPNNNSNIVLNFNSKNIGMDRNFKKVVDLSKGTYIWFCGQDDLISVESILYILNQIKNDNYKIDFYYLNYNLKKLWKENTYCKNVLNIFNDFEGKGVVEYHNAMGILLPTFLPVFLMKKEVWLKNENEIFYDTCYIQVGVFLMSLPNLKWKIIQKTLFEGIVPNNGWQNNNFKRNLILLGQFKMLIHAAEYTNDLNLKSYLKKIQIEYLNTMKYIIKESIFLKNNELINQVKYCIYKFSFMNVLGLRMRFFFFKYSCLNIITVHKFKVQIF
jgi:hypothetical protein